MGVLEAIELDGGVGAVDIDVDEGTFDELEAVADTGVAVTVIDTDTVWAGALDSSVTVLIIVSGDTVADPVSVKVA